MLFRTVYQKETRIEPARRKRRRYPTTNKSKVARIEIVWIGIVAKKNDGRCVFGRRLETQDSRLQTRITTSETARHRRPPTDYRACDSRLLPSSPFGRVRESARP